LGLSAIIFLHELQSPCSYPIILAGDLAKLGRALRYISFGSHRGVWTLYGPALLISLWRSRNFWYPSEALVDRLTPPVSVVRMVIRQCSKPSFEVACVISLYPGILYSCMRCSYHHSMSVGPGLRGSPWAGSSKTISSIVTLVMGSPKTLIIRAVLLILHAKNSIHLALDCARGRSTGGRAD